MRALLGTTRLLIATALALFLAGCGEDENDVRNTAPSVALQSDLTLVKAGIPVTFDSGAVDTENNISLYSWDFGDGVTAAGAGFPSIDHAFTSAGPYVVSVTVTDEEGLSATENITIDVTAAGGAPTMTVEEIVVRGRVIDGTATEVTVDATTTIVLSEGVFSTADSPASIPRTWNFDTIDQNYNTGSRILNITEP